MLKPQRIIRNYTPDYKALNTLDKQTKVIQELYDQVNEFYRFISEPAFRAEIKGEQGPQGEQGERGHDGAKGDKGATGDPGPQGFPGPRGADGLPGLQGPVGPQGPEGIPGPEGIRGPRGYTGLQGPQGPEGPEGKRGDSGSPFGLEGVFDTYAELVAEATRKNAKFYLVASNNEENGDLYVYRAKYDDFIFLNNLIYDLAFQIVQGPRGFTLDVDIESGEHITEVGTPSVITRKEYDLEGNVEKVIAVFNYLKGETGIQGPKGDKGDPGTDGVMIDDISTVESQEDGGINTTTITFTDGTYVNINIKNGSKGSTGATGPQGEQGIQGPIGPQGPQGLQGIQGITGKSSYELAVEQGYQGSLEEYLQLIKEIYVGTGSVYTDVFVAANKHENIKSPSKFNITANNNKIIVIYPSTNTYVGIPKINGIDIPMTVSTFTDDNVQYNVLISTNSYNDSLIITI